MEFSVLDHPNWVNPWGLLGVMRKSDLSPPLVSWLDTNCSNWRIAYRKAAPAVSLPVIVIEDWQTAELFKGTWLKP